MFLLKLNKLVNPAITMGFSKLKATPVGLKAPTSALKPPPMSLKRPPIDQNTKVIPKTEIKINNSLNLNEA